MTANPKVSVIMPLYNGERYVDAAIKSVLAQTYKNYELIVINDGSTDGSKHIITPLMGKPNFVYIERQNAGVASARNCGISVSTGELIAFLDQDDIWVPYKLELQVQFILDNPEIGMVHGNIKYIDENACFIDNKKNLWQTDASGWCFPSLFLANKIAVLTVCLRREVYKDIGLFREDIPGTDDYDYWLRVAYHYKIGHIAEILAYYRLHAENESHKWLMQEIRLSQTIEGILSRFPLAKSALGRKIINSRLTPIYQKIYNELYRTNEHNKARPFLFKSIAIDPTQLQCYGKILVGLLPVRIRSALRWYIQKYIRQA